MSAMIKNVNLYPAKRRTVRGDKWGYINDQGIFVINPKFQDAMDFEENGLAVVKVGDAYGIIDENDHRSQLDLELAREKRHQQLKINSSSILNNVNTLTEWYRLISRIDKH